MPKTPEMSGMHMPEDGHHHPDPNATFGTHGMLLFGEETFTSLTYPCSCHLIISKLSWR